MKYHYFTETDFVADEYFIQWIKEPNSVNCDFWESWLNQNPDKQEIVRNARKLLINLSCDQDKIGQWELDLIWENISLAKTASSPEKRVHQKAKLFIYKRSYSAAAAFVILLICGVIFYKLNFPATTEYATGYGEKRTIILPDKSVVVLNGNSILTVPVSWDNKEPRYVKLQGEAYFSVTHKQNNQKFIVNTSDQVQVEVLGTEFNVSTRNLMNQVVLKSGKIRLHIDKGTKTEQIEMQPGELVQISEKTEQVVEKAVRTEIYTAWKENKLLFDNTSLNEIAVILKNTYGYKVIFQDKSLQNLSITASLDSQNLDTVLATIAETLDIHIKKQNNQIIINE